MSLEAICRRVISLCGEVCGNRVLDVGCGDGLIGRALLPRVGSDGTVVFTDHDPDTITRLAGELADNPNAEFVITDARHLDGIPDSSVHLVTMRAVLLYIADRVHALAAARRVLATGGRLVISEPVNRVLYEPSGYLWGYDVQGIPEIAGKVQQAYLAHEAPHVRAMTNWTDQDLFTEVVNAGYRDVRMESVTACVPARPLPWLAFLHGRWTPWMPTVAQVIQAALDASERSSFEATLRPLVERGHQRLRICNTFLVATR